MCNGIIGNVMNNRGYDENDPANDIKKNTTNNENNAPNEENPNGIERKFKQRDFINVTRSVPTNIIQTIDTNKMDISSITNHIDGITGLFVSNLLGSITDLTGCSKVEGEGEESALMRERKFLALYMQLSEVRKL